MQLRDTVQFPNERGVATRRSIQSSLLRLLKKRPYSKITIKEIAALSGISPAAVYTYHESLDAIILATAEALEAKSKPLPEHLAHVVALLRFESGKGMS